MILRTQRGQAAFAGACIFVDRGEIARTLLDGGSRSLRCVEPQAASFEAIGATCLPNRAPSSSLADGLREPSAPAIVVAPHGLPPLISSSFIWPAQAYGKPSITMP